MRDARLPDELSKYARAYTRTVVSHVYQTDATEFAAALLRHLWVTLLP